MTKKAKKLGVKTTKTAVFDDKNFEVTESNNKDIPDQNNASKSKPNDEKEEELDKICSLIDKLTIDMLILMQQQMQQKLNIEKSMTDGELHLSKSRYIMGHKNVSSLQLPTENTTNIDPSATVEEINGDETMFGKPRLKLITENYTKHDKNKEIDEEKDKNIPDPLKWFGVLVPRDLRSAQDKFKDALLHSVDCANIQIRLHQVCVKIKQLTQLKEEMMQKNEE